MSPQTKPVNRPLSQCRFLLLLTVRVKTVIHVIKSQLTDHTSAHLQCQITEYTTSRQFSDIKAYQSHLAYSCRNTMLYVDFVWISPQCLEYELTSMCNRRVCHSWVLTKYANDKSFYVSRETSCWRWRRRLARSSCVNPSRIMVHRDQCQLGPHDQPYKHPPTNSHRPPPTPIRKWRCVRQSQRSYAKKLSANNDSIIISHCRHCVAISRVLDYFRYCNTTNMVQLIIVQPFSLNITGNS